MPTPRLPNSPYTEEYLNHPAMPLGGLGAGMLHMTGYGGFQDFSLHHRSAFFVGQETMFGCLHVRGERPLARLLEGPIPSWKVYGHGSYFPNGGPPLHGLGMPNGPFSLPRCQQASFQADFPFGHVELADPELPVTARLTGWSPFVPGDSHASSLPVIGLEYAFHNPGAAPQEMVFSFHAINPTSLDRHAPLQIERQPNALLFRAPANETDPAAACAFAIRVADQEACVDAAWFRGGWHDWLAMLWRDIAEGVVRDREPHRDGHGSGLGGSLYVPLHLAPGETGTVRLQICWYTPNSNEWEPRYDEYQNRPPAGTMAPWYAGQYDSVEALTDWWSAHYVHCRDRSAAFAARLNQADLPAEVAEAVRVNLAILKSPTILRQHDGAIYSWEGCWDIGGTCWGSCTHVWNYAQAMPHLFPDLERSLREQEFLVNQDERGHQNFRGQLPISPPRHDTHAAADGQLGGIVKLHREWRISGDTDWLRGLWPQARASLDYCIRTWDPDHSGMLREPHHNTYDIDFWGPDGMCTSFYLAALRAAVVMGEALGDDVSGYEVLFTTGRVAMESQLWNGEYFYQQVVLEGLYADPLAAAHDDAAIVRPVYDPESTALLEREGPKYQYGTGCLADGVIGDWMARVCGLGPILDEAKVRSHLLAVHRHNFRRSLHDHACTMRPGYAIGDEAGLILCTWPRGGRPALPFVYADEVWTGIEYQVAAHLIMLGCRDEGLEIVRAVRARYDGRVRNPFAEYELGQYYARAMSSYSLLQAFGVRDLTEH